MRRDVGLDVVGGDRSHTQAARDLGLEQLVPDGVARHRRRCALALQELAIGASLTVELPRRSRCARHAAAPSGRPSPCARTRLRSSSAVSAPARETPALVSAVSSAVPNAPPAYRHCVVGARSTVPAVRSGSKPGTASASTSQSVVVAGPQIGAGRGLLVGIGAAGRRERPPPPRPHGREAELAPDGEAGLRLQLDDLEPGSGGLQAGAPALAVTRLEAQHEPDARGRDAETGQAADPLAEARRGSRD